jgi:hypothetical protein
MTASIFVRKLAVFEDEDDAEHPITVVFHDAGGDVRAYLTRELAQELFRRIESPFTINSEDEE